MFLVLMFGKKWVLHEFIISEIYNSRLLFKVIFPKWMRFYFLSFSLLLSLKELKLTVSKTVELYEHILEQYTKKIFFHCYSLIQLNAV